LGRHRSGGRQIEQEPSTNRGPVKVGDVGPVAAAVNRCLDPNVDRRAALLRGSPEPFK
jgi:hypothetical protein